ncbi:MAG TPA: hypothetical protein VKA31_05460 [Mariprofundaceae bacterium]|nr:hypothetical protein [Mariprofundaceae bacterium]
MDSISTLYWGLLFSSIGLGFFVYGKKQKAFVPVFCGIGLIIVPYFISNVPILIISGIAIMAVACFVRV